MTEGSEEWETDIEALSPSGWVVSAGIALIFASVVALLIFQFFPRNGLTAFAAITSAAFSGLLALLYYFQTKVQNRQSKLMRRQQDIMELDFLPKIYSKDVRLVDDVRSSEVTHDQIDLLLHNVGAGVATNIHLRCDVSVQIGSTHTDLVDDNTFESEGGNFSFAPHFMPLIQKDSSFWSSHTSTGGILVEGESAIFSSTVQVLATGFDFGDADSRTVQFNRVIDELAQIGGDIVFFHLSIVYRDVNKNIHAERIGSGAFELSEGMTLSEGGLAGGNIFIELDEIRRDATDYFDENIQIQ